MNDLRFHTRSNVTESGGGIAYIVDSSNEGRTGLIMIDLGTEESWRQLIQYPCTLRVYADVQATGEFHSTCEKKVCYWASSKRGLMELS